MANTFSITCTSTSAYDKALFKSLIGIVGRGNGTEWIYSDSSKADVVIVDTDDRSNLALLRQYEHKAVVSYASADRRLPNTFSLPKPARARELMQLLASIRARLEASNAA